MKNKTRTKYIAALILGGICGYLISTLFETNNTTIIHNNNTLMSPRQPAPTYALQNYKTSDNWEGYKHPLLKYTISIPPSTVVTEEDIYDTRFEDEKHMWTIKFIKDYDAMTYNLEDYFFKDYRSTRIFNIGKRRIAEYVFANGYCDGPVCSKPFIAYTIYENNAFQTLSFFNDTKLDSIEQKILYSFDNYKTR